MERILAAVVAAALLGLTSCNTLSGPNALRLVGDFEAAAQVRADIPSTERAVVVVATDGDARGRIYLGSGLDLVEPLEHKGSGAWILSVEQSWKGSRSEGEPFPWYLKSDVLRAYGVELPWITHESAEAMVEAAGIEFEDPPTETQGEPET